MSGDLVPYVVVPSARAAALDLAAAAIAPAHCFDPLRTASAPFLDALGRLDALALGPRGLATPRWALYDCAELAGFVAGLGRPSPEGLEPLSSLVVVPMPGEGRWLVRTLAAAPDLDPDALPDTLALGLALARAREITGAAGWSSPALRALAHLAPLRVLAAWLPTHDVPATAVARLAPRSRRDPSSNTVLLDARDDDALRRLQTAIEAGSEALLEGPPSGDAPCYPLSLGGSP